MAESTRQHWDEFWASGSRPAEPNRKIVETISSLGDLKGRKVLEVGAGRGADSVFLAQQGADAHVLDYSREALELSRKFAQDAGIRLVLVEADALDIPFPPESFDFIFHQGFLEHFRDPGKILAEQYRILKQGGMLLVDVPQKYTLYTLRKQIAIRRGTWFAGWETQYGPRKLEKLMKQAGFSIVAIYAWGMAGSYGWGLRNALHSLKSAIRTADDGKTVPSNGSARGGTVSSSRVLPFLADNVGIVGRK